MYEYVVAVGLVGQKGTTGIPPLSDSRNLASLLLERYPMWFYPRKGMAEKRLQERLAELNERLSYLQARNNPADAEEFIRLYQERRELLKELGNAAAKISAS